MENCNLLWCPQQDRTHPKELPTQICSRAIPCAHESAGHLLCQDHFALRYIYKISRLIKNLEAYTPWAPALYNTSEKGLLWVVSNIGTKAIDNASKVIVEAAYYLCCCHSRPKSTQNLGKRRMEQLPSEFTKLHIIHVGLISYRNDRPIFVSYHVRMT